MKADANQIDRPRPIATKSFRDAEAAVERLELIYDRNTAFIRERFARLLKTKRLDGRVRATYPEIRIETSSYAQIDSRLSYGHVAGPGVYSATVTQPRAVPQLSRRTDTPAHPQPRRAGRDWPVIRADPAAFRVPRGHLCRGRALRPHRSPASRHVRRARSRRHRRCHRQRHPSVGAGHADAAGAVHRLSASTIRCIACRTTPPPTPSISRTSSSSPTTSSTSTSSCTGRGG